MSAKRPTNRWNAHQGIFEIYFTLGLVFALSGTSGQLLVSSGANVRPIRADYKDAAFPEYFLFGASTSAYQIEGAWNVDGKSPSIWDDMVHHHPELIAANATGDVAADSYHLYEEDIRALKAVGFHVYRFSIAWTRILPDCLSPNPAGIKHYSDLIDRLLAEGIEPIVTMYHYDLPRCMQDLGGWMNPLVQDYFLAYADVLFGAYGSRVKRWVTVNEPFYFCVHGYGTGEHAPHIKGAHLGAEYLCGDNVLKAHANVYHLYHDRYARRFGGKVGVSLNSEFYYPANESDDELGERALQFQFGWFAHAIFSPTANYYPPIIVETVARNSVREGRPWSRLPQWSAEWKAKIHGSADFLGLNYYTSHLVQRANRTGPGSSIFNDINLEMTVNSAWVKSKSSWLCSVPSGLGDMLRWIRDEYDNPEVVITENGWSDDGQLNDTGRVTYMRDHLREVLRAVVQDDCNVTGYTAWSMLDNFEWQEGFTEYFGMFSVDLESPSKNRTAKASADFMKRVVKTRRIPDM